MGNQMKLHVMIAVLCLLLVSGWAVAEETPIGEPPHWTYEGAEGPEFWGNLAPEYELCGVGHSQSPIDVKDAQLSDLKDIGFAYQPSAMSILNNGHTIQVNYDAGSSITYGGSDYTLKQFHFHHPSEHIINGQSAAMEIHFVHQNAAGYLAVVGVMLVEGSADNPAYAPIFNALPAEKSDPQAIGTINAADLLPPGATFYTYTGSLTTPPCSQGVRWLLLTEPVEVSAAQIAAFAAIFEMNARPVQPLNTRELEQDNS
jgi:carbonic anhydrase